MTRKYSEYKLSDKLDFGKHEGKTVQDVISGDPEWLEWAMDEIDWFDLDDDASSELDLFSGEFWSPPGAIQGLR